MLGCLASFGDLTDIIEIHVKINIIKANAFVRCQHTY